ncbi:hypothetical protein E2C01_059162 [Portunus trituberculatus]|uniref:Uncharacterized protein n=1 Tax=Portunus trituberculatus TaxID=210409 RepID=A0A5B7H7L1_PORTR|nr:hypothetical protein [Portunus trituberculatus]
MLEILDFFFFFFFFFLIPCGRFTGIYGLKAVLFLGTSYLKAHLLGYRCPE